MRSKMFVAAIAISCFTTAATASPSAEQIAGCNDAFVSTVISINEEIVTVAFSSGITREMAETEKHTFLGAVIGDKLCLQDDVD